ncbi:MAG: acetyltransferase [Kiritimatiellia bacterium]
MKRIIIVGAGGLGREVAWVIERVNQIRLEFELVGLCDDDLSRGADLAGIVPFLGSIKEVMAAYSEFGYICAIGSNRTRLELMRMFDSEGFKALPVVDPSAVVAEDAQVGAGTYIGINSVVSIRCCIGRGCIVNHNATIGHDVVLGDFAQVCPGVSVSGGCVIGAGALLGSNSCTIPCKSMGAWSTLGAGGVLLTDLEEGGSRVRVR